MVAVERSDKAVGSADKTLRSSFRVPYFFHRAE